ncbi:MAG: patatin-like phospholipase family protein, partial [Bacteroidota bacterium]
SFQFLPDGSGLPGLTSINFTNMGYHFHLSERIQSESPKRILSLDGGGIRGALALGYLAKIEDILREKHGNPRLRLCEYFDLIGGTSTGAIIAGALARGYQVRDIQKKYEDMGRVIFARKKSFLISLISKERFREKVLERVLRSPDLFDNLPLGSNALQTCVAIFTKRVDTNSLCILTNNPNFQHFERQRHVPLWRAIKASAVPPTVFRAVDIEGLSDPDEACAKGAFTDGAIGIAGNPALWLLIMSQLEAYGFNWKPGEDNLLLVSVGSGKDSFEYDPEAVLRWKPLNWAGAIVDMFLHDSKEFCEMILQLLSQTKTPRHFDGILGDVTNRLHPGQPLLTYLRYNFPLTKPAIAALGNRFADITLNELTSLRCKTNGHNAARLFEIGWAAAEAEVRPEHFPDVFDCERAVQRELAF